jgi:hypothetical protein
LTRSKNYSAVTKKWIPGCKINSDKSAVIFHDIPNDAYHADRSHESRSSAHRKRGADGGRSQRYLENGGSLFGGNAGTRFGTVVDVLFGFDIEKRTLGLREIDCPVVCPPSEVLTASGHRRGKAYTQWKNSLPLECVETTQDSFDEARRILDAIMEHNEARRLVEKTLYTQQSVFYTDDRGHKRKARADGSNDSSWYDLKTTSSEFSELKFSFRRFGYDWQAAWYMDAARTVGCKNWDDFPFVVAQTFPPYNVRVVRIAKDKVQRAEEEIATTLDQIKERRETGNYIPEAYHECFELDLY